MTVSKSILATQIAIPWKASANPRMVVLSPVILFFGLSNKKFDVRALLIINYTASRRTAPYPNLWSYSIVNLTDITLQTTLLLTSSMSYTLI